MQWNILSWIPVRWQLSTIISVGVLVGLGLFVVYISNFFSYLSNEPKTCMNCHIMGPEYVTWSHSAHRETATCVDCHIPQDNIAEKLIFKGMDGMRHSAILTIRGEEQAIIIKEAGKKAVQSNCIRCHQGTFTHVQGMEGHPQHVNAKIKNHSDDKRVCWECHRETPHGTIRSLSSAPFARVPTTGSVVPNWLQSLMNKEHTAKSIQR